MTPDGVLVVMRNSLSTKMLSVVCGGVGGEAVGGGGMAGGGAGGRLGRAVQAAVERQARLASVQRDLQLALPPAIALPDGEERPYGASTRLHIRTDEQESEIYQKCIRAPPNRTVFESESPPPYRSSSAGLLGSLASSSSGNSDWSTGSTPLVVRCHSMSSTSKRQDPAPTSQKTDFLQRTVKIFTGKKNSQPPSAPTLPVVIVPTRARRVPESRTKQNNV